MARTVDDLDRRGVIRFDPRTLAALLNLPRDVHIVAVHREIDPAGIGVSVVSDLLDPVDPACQAPQIAGRLVISEGGTIARWMPRYDEDGRLMLGRTYTEQTPVAGAVAFIEATEATADDLGRIIREQIGRASTCWDAEGVFKSEEALDCAATIEAAIKAARFSSPDLPPWTMHDGAGRRYRAVHPDDVNQEPDQPNDQVPPLARLIPFTDSAGNPT